MTNKKCKKTAQVSVTRGKNENINDEQTQKKTFLFNSNILFLVQTFTTMFIPTVTHYNNKLLFLTTALTDCKIIEQPV